MSTLTLTTLHAGHVHSGSTTARTHGRVEVAKPVQHRTFPFSVDICEKDCGNGRTPPPDDGVTCRESIFTVAGCDRCDTCPNGKVREPFTMSVGCVCSGSFARNSGVDEHGKCMECRTGYYGQRTFRGNSVGDHFCKPCPRGTFSLKVLQETSIDSGERGGGFGPRQACVKFPVDSFTDEEGQVECKKCIKGTFTYFEGSKKFSLLRTSEE